jgi:beta-N-acetylhexosaminidase
MSNETLSALAALMYRIPCLLALLLIAACTKTKTAEEPPPPVLQESAPLQEHDEQESAPDPFRAAAERIVAGMTERELAGQVLMTGVDGNTALSAQMKRLLHEYPVGALILFGYNIAPDAQSITGFLADCQNSAAGMPLFIAVDHEGGLVQRFGDTIERIPAPAEFWRLAEEQGVAKTLQELEETVYRSAQAIRCLGITLNLAPVAEIVNAENSRFLETRSFGPDPLFTQQAVSTFVRSMKRAGVACAVKHFPGNSGSDPHKARSVLQQTKEELSEMVSAFTVLIRTEKPAAIMLSHIVVSAVDPLHNASLSPQVVQWLRDELGFSGIILADDFSMAAVAETGIGFEEALIAGLNAGVDMMMTWPSLLAQSHTAIMNALKDGTLQRSRLEEAVFRIVREKATLGLLGNAF